MKKQFYIVWNEAKSEGFITDDESDAKQAKSGKFRNPYSSVGEAFHEAYDDEKLSIEKITMSRPVKP